MWSDYTASLKIAGPDKKTHLPPGRAKLAMRPSPIGSLLPAIITMGIVEVAGLNQSNTKREKHAIYLLQQHVQALTRTADAIRRDIGNGEALGAEHVLTLREVREGTVRRCIRQTRGRRMKN